MPPIQSTGMQFTIQADDDFPTELLHYDVCEAIRIPDGDYQLPRWHIVILRNPGKSEAHAYSTHDVAYQKGWNGQDGPWVLNDGRYDMSYMRAVHSLLERAKDHMPLN